MKRGCTDQPTPTMTFCSSCEKLTINPEGGTALFINHWKHLLLRIYSSARTESTAPPSILLLLKKHET
jgi:hypothetical protein